MASGEAVLVFRPGALGDTLLTVPALRGLRRTYPNAEIELVGHRDAGKLLVAQGIVDRARAFDDLTVLPLFFDPPRIPPDWQGAKLVVLWMADSDRQASAFRTAGAGQVVACSPTSRDGGVHTAQHLVATLAEAGVAPVSGEELEGFSAQAGGQELARRVVIHPGSGAPAKNWPLENFAEVAGEIADAGWQVALVEGPADAEAVSRVRAALGAGRVEVVRPPSIGDLAKLLEGAALYVGNDSGVSHLAGLVGIRTLTIFGATDPRVWSPLGPWVRILGEKNRWPSVEEVRRTATDWRG